MGSVGFTFQIEIALATWCVVNKVLYVIVAGKSFQFPAHNSKKKILPALLKIISNHGVP